MNRVVEILLTIARIIFLGGIVFFYDNQNSTADVGHTDTYCSICNCRLAVFFLGICVPWAGLYTFHPV